MGYTQTENGAIAYSSTGNAALDLFSFIGAARRAQNMIVELFNAAFDQNVDLATRILVWARDCRGGAGERKTFRTILLAMANGTIKNPLAKDVVIHLIESGKIEFFGRWDDLLIFLENECDSDVRLSALEHIKTAVLDRDQLACKWMPRKGITAVMLRNYMKLSPREYRRLLVDNTTVVETAMCDKSWGDIDFSKVTARNLSDYSNAFKRHATDNWYSFKIAAKKGLVNIKSDSLFPYDVLRTALYGDKVLADMMWNSMPNFISGQSNILPIIDSSGSMVSATVSGAITAMDVAVSLGWYVSSKQTGQFKDFAISFSDSPSLFKMSQWGSSLESIYDYTKAQPWGMNTNLKSVFELIIYHALKNRISPENMPSAILIISDMQFDKCVHDDWQSNEDGITPLDFIKSRFISAGYKVPTVIFWNVNTKTKSFPLKTTDKAIMVSGFSPAILQTVFNLCDNPDPVEIMRMTVMADRYSVFGSK